MKQRKRNVVQYATAFVVLAAPVLVGGRRADHSTTPAACGGSTGPGLQRYLSISFGQELGSISVPFHASRSSEQVILVPGDSGYDPSIGNSRIVYTHLDSSSRLYVFNERIRNRSFGTLPTPCYEQLNFNPQTIAISPASGTTPNVSAANFEAQCSRSVDFHCAIYPSSDLCTYRLGCGTFYGPADTRALFCGCELPDERAILNIANAPNWCRCQYAGPPVQCVRTPSGATVNPYSPFTNPHDTSRVLENLPVTPVQWARLPYSQVDTGGDDDVTLSWLDASGARQNWVGPVQTMRNYDVGECDATFSWQTLAGIMARDGAEYLGTALQNGNLPERLAPTDPTSCNYRSQISSVYAEVAAGPVLSPLPINSDGTPTGDTNDQVAFYTQFRYAHDNVDSDHPAIDRRGNVFVQTRVTTQNGRIAVPFRPDTPGFMPVSILGESQTSNFSAYNPLGWDLATLFRGSLLNPYPYAGACRPNPIPPASFPERLRLQLHRRSHFYWRLPWPTQSAVTPSCASLVPAGPPPVYAFCHSASPSSYTATGDTIDQGDCGAVLAAMVQGNPQHPLLRALRDQGLTQAELLAAPSSGCYAMETLPPWVRSEPEVANRIQENTNLLPSQLRNGICGFRFNAQRVNILPDGLQVVIAETRQSRGYALYSALSSFFHSTEGRSTRLPPFPVDCRRDADVNPTGFNGVQGVAVNPDGTPQVGRIGTVPEAHGTYGCSGPLCRDGDFQTSGVPACEFAW